MFSSNQGAETPSVAELHWNERKNRKRETLEISTVGVHPFGLTSSVCATFGAGRVVGGGPPGTLAIPLRDTFGREICFLFWDRRFERWYYPAWLDREMFVFNAHSICRGRGLIVARNPLEVMRQSFSTSTQPVAFLTEYITQEQIAQIKELGATHEVTSISFF